MESAIELMNKKMDRVNNDNMDIINIMKIDRIEQSLDVIRSKNGESNKTSFNDKRKRKMSVAASSISHSSSLLFDLGDLKDNDKGKSKKNNFDVFGDKQPFRRNKTTVNKKEFELSSLKKKSINNIMNTLSEGSEESSSSETQSIATNPRTLKNSKKQKQNDLIVQTSNPTQDSLEFFLKTNNLDSALEDYRPD